MIRTGAECPSKKGQSFACLGLLRSPQFHSGSGARFVRATPDFVVGNLLGKFDPF